MRRLIHPNLSVITGNPAKYLLLFMFNIIAPEISLTVGRCRTKRATSWIVKSTSGKDQHFAGCTQIHLCSSMHRCRWKWLCSFELLLDEEERSGWHRDKTPPINQSKQCHSNQQKPAPQETEEEWREVKSCRVEEQNEEEDEQRVERRRSVRQTPEK